MRAISIIAALCLASCASEPAPAPSSTPTPTPAASPVAGPARDPAAIEAMKKQLLGLRKVTDILYSEDGPVVWQVGVRSMQGSGVGYAESICMDLADKGLVDDHTDVRIVNLDNPAARSGDFRTASIGHVRCRDGSNLGT